MRILLVGINAKYIHSNPALYYLRNYVLANVKDKALYEASIQIVEYTINQDNSAILRDLALKKPDVVAVSCYLWNISYVHTLIKSFAKVSPTTDIWLGGPEVSFDAENQLKKYPMIRGVIAGEGEDNFLRVAKHYVEQSEESLPRVLHADGKLDFDDVPFPYEDLSEFQNRIVYYETSRGCPFGCAYCLSSVDTKVRLRSLPLVEKELQFFLDAKVPLVKFVDRTFNCNPKHTLGILQYLKNHDNGVTCFHFEMAAELITDEEMEILTSLRPGQVQIEIGVQTTNADTLCAINRKADFSKLSAIVRKLVAAGNMHVHVDLIAGLPYEDLATFEKSFGDVYALHANELQLGFLKVLKGSPLELHTKEYGIVYADEPPYEVLKTKWLSYEDIVELKGVEEMLEVYYNSGQFVNTIRFLEKHLSKNAYELYKSLYDYYVEHGYYGISHNRYERYRILRDYALTFWKETSEEMLVLTEELLHDLYLRDNVKSRPSYGSAGLVDKAEYRCFFESLAYRNYFIGYENYEPAQAARMIHIEKRRDGYMLYDYQRRNPVNDNATTIFLQELS